MLCILLQTVVLGWKLINQAQKLFDVRKTSAADGQRGPNHLNQTSICFFFDCSS